MAAPTRLIQTTWRGLEGGCLRAAGGRLSGEGLGSVTGGLGSVMEGRGHLDALVSVAEVAAALLLMASECWLWEVEVDALLRLEGKAVVPARQEASLEVVQGQHEEGKYLLAQEQVQVAGAGYLEPAFVVPH